MLVPAGYFSSQKYISQSEWGTLWQSCLKADYTPMIRVQAVKPKKGTLNGTLGTSKDTMAHAVCETLKYSVKPEDLLADPKWLSELTKQLQKTRSISIGGCLKEFFSEDDPEDLINGDIEEDEKTEDESYLTFEWSNQIKRYQKSIEKTARFRTFLDK
jgi:hypothetical protein